MVEVFMFLPLLSLTHGSKWSEGWLHLGLCSEVYKARVFYSIPPLQNVGPFSNFRGLVHLGSRALIALKFEYVKEEVELHLLYDLHGEV